MNQENKSKCCGAEKDFLGRFAEKGDWCSKCGKPFIPQSLEEKCECTKCKKEFNMPKGFFGRILCEDCDSFSPTDSKLKDKQKEQLIKVAPAEYNNYNILNKKIKRSIALWIRRRNDTIDLDESLTKIIQNLIQSERELEREKTIKMLSDMKPILYHEDKNRHLENVAVYNFIDKVIKII